MADVGPALVTGVATIVGVVAGAGLTYWFSALNHRHQEAREDETRWYEARLKAYGEFSGLMQAGRWALDIHAGNLERLHEQAANLKSFNEQLVVVAGAVRLVASPEVVEECSNVCGVWAAMAIETATVATEMAAMDDSSLVMALATKRKSPDHDQLLPAIAEFEKAARKDLGHPIKAR